MRSSGIAAGPTGRPNRNDPCPCGSGRKFKRCCGIIALATQATLSKKSQSGSGPGAPFQESMRGDKPKLAPSARTAFGESVGGLASDLPPALFAENGAPARRKVTTPQRLIDAERLWQQGLRLIETNRFAAAIAALNRATDLDPRNAAAHHALGLAFLRSGRFEEAVASLGLAIIFNDNFPDAYRELASALDELGRCDEAVTACKRAIELAPQSADGHRLLGELLEAAGETEEAAECYRRAASAASDTTAGRLDLVRALLLQRDFQQAENRIREAIALEPGNDELHKTLGQLLAAQGRFDEAIEACDRAIELNPLQVPAHLTAVRVRKCTESDRPRLVRMLSTLRNSTISDSHRQFLHFAIGKLLDDLGEYSEAMRHFDIANHIRSGHARLNREAFVGHIDRLLSRFSADFFAANSAFGLEDETPLLIVGMPRSGTTLVEQIVSSHPLISAGEELFFWFNRARLRGIAEATSLTPEAGRGLATEYLALLRRIGPSSARVTDKQPFNFQQLGLIHLLLPKARIIHCHRHPIDTCLSMYFTYFKGKVEFVSNKADLAFAYQQYARIMDHWRSALPSDRFFEVDYEALVADHERITRQLITFTGLQWNDACLQPERNGRNVGTASVWQVRQPVFTTSIERWRRYEPWVGELRQLVP